MSTLDIAISIAREAGDVLLRFFGTNLGKTIKTGPTDYATEADRESEHLIISRIASVFPEDAIVAEESGSHGSKHASYTWIIDPLDGTHNFASGKDDFAVMIARINDNEPELAVIYNPKKNITASAEKGKGTTLNGKPVLLSDSGMQDKPLSVEQNDQKRLEQLGYRVTHVGAGANTIVTLAGERKAYVSSTDLYGILLRPRFS